jgi:hypothetical protein
MTSSRRLGVDLFGLLGYRRKQQLRNILFCMGSQGKNLSENSLYNSANLADFHLKSCTEGQNLKIKSSGRKS